MKPVYVMLKPAAIFDLASRVATAAGGDVTVDRASVEALFAAMVDMAGGAVDSADDKAGQPLRERVIVETSLAVMWQVATRPPVSRALSKVLSELVIREFASVNGYVFVFKPNDLNFGTLCDLLPANAEWALSEAGPWLSSHLLPIPEGSTPDVQLELPLTDEIRAFIAVPMTGQDADIVSRLEKHSNELAEVCSDFGINTFQPIMFTHPIRHPGPAHNPAVHASDFDRLSQSDLLIAVLMAGSFGVGKLVRHAESLMMPTVVFLGGPMRLNPMVHGTRANQAVFDLTNSTKGTLTYYLNKSYHDLERHRWLRVQRVRWAPILRQLQAGLRDSSKLQAEVAPLLPLDRAWEICSSVDKLAGASFEEMQVLFRAFAPTLEAIDDGELSAGLSAAEVTAAGEAARAAGWGVDDFGRYLANAAARPGPAARRRLLTPAAWRAFAQDGSWPHSA